MAELHQISPFTDSTAVEAWDAWFRWRDQAGLHDISIEHTWTRVASMLATPEVEAASWHSRFLSALSSWRLLPDERILASAGTGEITWREGPLRASLNAAAFVSAGTFGKGRMELAALMDGAELALQTLDNAALIGGLSTPRLRVGLIGVADALWMLGLGYDSHEGRAMASAIGKALAEGCFRASIALARRRGVCGGNTSEAIARGVQRELPEELLREAEDYGLRYQKLTAITSQQRLALLANVVANALDPLVGKNHRYAFIAPGGERKTTSSGYALGTHPVNGISDEADTVDELGWLPQLRMRAAVQPYVDEPIGYPLLVSRNPSDRQTRDATLEAARFGLPTPAWQNVSDALYSCARELL